ncbi:uncharacterized protein PHACADRAFT_175334 [Phanerochaete carnosa HHB-10118-sp]|uniref:RBR-type E3 ubiquitin transferase n=1 Tax=Phanerochaete carnosa (strain HHB-10118-sp) TaxID=650164 RepID=K5UXM6_PHACS|nr:uncharacterized protein PHACADRAFT_175334 [Phanerochaete carnosa HHB-10118-sp]EKM54826.1 hypothetical protein PHACADRAFT_175334 [Phanerochaete carnosa HHB-10118-sp]
MSTDNEYSDQDYYDEDEDVLLDDAEDESASEMDIDAFDADYKPSGKGKHKVYEVEYESLSQGDIEKMMKDDVNNISGIFGVDGDSASLLLRHFEWNKEKLIEKFMDNAATVNAAAGISAPEKPQSEPSQPSGNASPLVCNHKFCTSCWNAYITSKIRTEAEQWITCMAEDCKTVAPNSFVQTSLQSEMKTWQRFQELLVRHFVSCNHNLKYCPYPSCTYTVSCPSAASKSSLTQIVPVVVCGASSTHKFCFGCNIDDDHRPVVCGVARLWLQKCQDDSETANWIKSNTKECSKCQSTIEKNGGCNHMTCKKCKYEFCWVCMGPWSEHGTAWYSCNRYDEKASVDARDAQSKSRASLERYLHYYNRWANHEQSAKLSVELHAKTEKKMEEMQMSSDLTWIEVQFMKKAVDEVFKCRMTLKWTYAMAYYLESGNQKELFEDNQRDLERAVEELSELIEQPLDPEIVPSLRQKVTDKTVYVQKRNEIVLEDTAKGFLEGRWSWNAPVEGFD